jgi:hypothetical protein
MHACICTKSSMWRVCYKDKRQQGVPTLKILVSARTIDTRATIKEATWIYWI